MKLMEAPMSKHNRVYHSEKRKKEVARQKKQEEKRQRRLNKKNEAGEAPAGEGDQPAAPDAETKE
jgi:hypothetical protein